MNVSSSLKFAKCIITLPDGEELSAQLKYEPAAYMQGSEFYPANIVVFKANETCKIEHFGLKHGWGAEFIQECINYAICEGDDIEGVVDEICANGGDITWKLVGEV